MLGPPVLRGLGVGKSPAKETGGRGPVGAEGSSGHGLLGSQEAGGAVMWVGPGADLFPWPGQSPFRSRGLASGFGESKEENWLAG